MLQKGNKKDVIQTKVMVFGTFDGVHKGHENFFKQAKALIKNPYLIVSIARDKNVKKIKGKLPDKNEKERLSLIGKCRLVDKVILGGLDQYLPHIVVEKPDIIALGYDQVEYVKDLKKDLKNLDFKIKVIRLKPHKEHIYKNHLIKQKTGL